MTPLDIYKTIEAPSEGIYKEKGSKFIAYAYPVWQEAEIKEIVANLKTEFYDARHHCYAYQLGVKGDVFRANDDGEPSGTGGKPIHGQIRSSELTNILIVVVRYFGGTKLGVSGLINAYKMAAADAIANATIVERTVNDVYRIGFDYGVMNDVMKVLKEENPEILSQDFNLNCSILLSIRQNLVDSFVNRITKIESVKADFVETR